MSQTLPFIYIYIYIYSNMQQPHVNGAIIVPSESTEPDEVHLIVPLCGGKSNQIIVTHH